MDRSRSVITRLRQLAVLSIAMLAMLPLAWAQQGRGLATVYAIGSSPLVSENMSASRQNAVSNALEVAANRVLVDTLSQERLSANFQVISDAVLGRTDQFVRDYKVIAESTFGKTYRVMVQANVSVDRLNAVLADAGVSRGSKGQLRILFCVAEKNVDDPDFQFWWGNPSNTDPSTAAAVMGQAMQTAGFAVVVPGGMGVLDDSADLGVDRAVFLAGQLKADAVILGRAMAEESPNSMGGALQTFRGDIDVRAYFVDGSQPAAEIRYAEQVVAADSQAGSREALAKAAIQAGERLAHQIEGAWLGQGGGVAPVEMVIEGTGGNIANFVQFRGALGTMAGVDTLQLKEMMPNAAVLSITYQGNTRTLAEALMSLSFSNFGIHIIETGSQHIRLQLIPR
jgi:hypothetical protein